MKQILPGEDTEISNLLNESLKRQKISVYTGVRVDSIELRDEGVTAKLSSGETLEANKALIAIGRIPNTKGIGLEKFKAHSHLSPPPVPQPPLLKGAGRR